MDGEVWHEKLNKLGLSRYEARVYLALLEEGVASAPRIVRKSGVPQPRVYVALGVLVERGFAELVLGESREYRAIPPKVVFERHHRRQEAAFRSAMDEMSAEMDALQKALPENPTGDPSSYGIRLVRGREPMARAITELYAEARNEICLFLRYPAVFNIAKETRETIFANGAKLRLLVERKFLEDPAIAESYHNYARDTGNLRWRETLPFRTVIIDKKINLLPMQETDNSPTLLIVPNDVLAGGMQRLFEEFWEQARPASEIPVPLKAAASASQ